MVIEIEEKDIIEYLQKETAEKVAEIMKESFHSFETEAIATEILLDDCGEYLTRYHVEAISQ